MDEVRARVVDLDLNDVLPNRFQPRIKFSEDSIIELSESIKEHGVIQPIVVRPIADKYEIIAGERRYKASVLAGKDTIPAIITELNDKDSAEVALIENVQRKDLTAIEEAISYKKILDMGYLTQEQLAVKLGKSQSTVANKIRLLNLCDEVQEALMEEKISERHARSMLKLSTAAQQKIMLDKIIKERLTVRKTDEEIEKMNTYITNDINNPDTPASNPGFVDVDKIANNAQDLKFEDSSGNVNINALLQGNGPMVSNPEEASIPVIPTMDSNPAFNPAMQATPVALDSFVPNIEPVVPTVAPSMPEIPAVPTVESVMPVQPATPAVDLMATPSAPVMPEIPVVPVAEPVIPVVEPVQPVSPAVDLMAAPSAPVMPEIPVVPTVDIPVATPASEPVISVPTITPVVPDTTPIAPMPTTPIVEESLPNKFLNTEEEPEVVAPVSPVVPVENINNELTAAEAKLEDNPQEIKPIIITDYSKQYDPVLPEQPAAREKIDFKQIINLIRDVSNTIEKCGYSIDTEEYDLEGVYQVIFKINKN